MTFEQQLSALIDEARAMAATEDAILGEIAWRLSEVNRVRNAFITDFRHLLRPATPPPQVQAAQQPSFLDPQMAHRSGV